MAKYKEIVTQYAAITDSYFLSQVTGKLFASHSYTIS